MAIGIGRRQFISALGGTVVGLPLIARAQQPKVPVIGFLGPTTPSAWSSEVPAFEKRLGELGWLKGRSILIEYRWAEGRSEYFTQLANEFVRLKVDVIVTAGQAALEVKKATSVIPIVFAVANDPVESGLVESLARPGGNITGLSMQNPDLAGKRVNLLREVLPDLRRFAIMADAGYPASAREMNEVEAAAQTLGLETTRSEIRRVEDIVPAIETIKGHVQALYVCGADTLVVNNRIAINTLALAARLPTMQGAKAYLEGGGLISYGANLPDSFRRAADFVDKILHGAKPVDIPVEQPTKFDLVINLKTAKALGLTVPTTLLATADEVIE